MSPLLSNIVLDELDKELERRGLCFVRYADDCVIFVKSERAANRVNTMKQYKRKYKRFYRKENAIKGKYGKECGRPTVG